MGIDAERALFLEAELMFAKSSADGALARLSFDGPLAEVNQRNAALPALEEDIGRARARGYMWAGDLEQRLADVKTKGAAALATARSEANRATGQLNPRVNALVRNANDLAGADPGSNAGRIESLAAECRSVGSALDAAEQRVREAVAPFTSVVDDLDRRVKKVHWTLDHFEAAAFKMMPEENPVHAVSVTWDDPPDGRSRDGLLTLTDHRLRFEHFEETVVERTLVFFASRKETRRVLWIDVPLGVLASSDDSERGLVFKDQLLTFVYKPAPNTPQRTTFQIHDATAKEVDTLVEQLRAGDLERSRYRGQMPTGSQVGVPVKWPEKCVTCGAPMRPPVKGQTVIVCDYCNANHAVEFGPTR